MGMRVGCVGCMERPDAAERIRGGELLRLEITSPFNAFHFFAATISFISKRRPGVWLHVTTRTDHKRYLVPWVQDPISRHIFPPCSGQAFRTDGISVDPGC